jgi:putative lipoic acid-binding regulatory protein
MFSHTTNVTIAGAGLYSWFDAYDQSVCVDVQNCQQRLIYDQEENGGLWIFNLVTIGAVEMISSSGGAIETAKNNTQANAHPFWSALALWGDESDPVILLCDDDDKDCPGDPPCDLTLDFADLDALGAAQSSGSVKQMCVPYHVVNALGHSLETSLAAYNDANSGYDEVWKYYAEGFRGSVDAIIRNFTGSSSSNNRTGGPGLKYFDCTITLDGRDTTKQCPFDFIELAFYDSFDMKYTLRDANGFYDALNKTFGIAKDWVGFEDLDNSSTQCPGGGGGHPGNGPNPARRGLDAEDADHDHEDYDESQSQSHSKIQKRCARRGARFKGIPHGLDKYDVPNPKDVITKAMPNMQDLVIQLAAREVELAMGDYNGTVSDTGQALSLPVFMMAESIEQMKQAKEKGKELKDKKDIEFLEKVLGIVFMFLPFIDELGPELLLFEGIATGVGFLGDTALAVKDIIEHPENAFMDVIGIVTEAAFLRTGKGYKDAADLRRGMDSALIEKSGKTIKQLDDKLQDVLGKACSR